MNRPRDQLLSGAALPGDEDARARRGDLFDFVKEPLYRGALADHLVLRELLSRDGFEGALVVGRLEHVLDAHEDALASQRFLEEIARPELDRVDRVVHSGVSADNDDRRVPRCLLTANALEGLEAAHLRKLYVEDR